MKNIFTIPNIISMFRLVLVPLFVITYFNESNDNYYLWSILIILISGISDIVDGFVARHFGMVSDLGKVLDPIADKLTQVVVILSLAIKHPTIFPMFVVLFVKELLTLLVAAHLLSKGTKPISSKWFGKLSTVVIFLTMFYTVVVDIQGITEIPLYILIVLSIICMVISILGYFKIFSKQVKGEGQSNETV
ncbi:MAG: CDP-alcohol phosphatidyltransferase family protein [Acutalibacteraceae bacterium]|nr:CDP-alcohol phosphatidyltransferase family protein [Acutalibacteraceae bacterium]